MTTRRRQAEVLARDAAAKTCSLKIMGDDTQHDGVVSLPHYVPRVGDTVWCLQEDISWLIIGGQDTLVPSVRIRRTADFTHNSSGAELAVTFPAGSVSETGEEYDTDGLFDTAQNTRLTASWPGLWSVTAGGVWASNATGRRYLKIRKNGTIDLKESGVPTVAAVAFGNPPPSTQIRMIAGDYVELMAFQNSGGNLALQSFANHSVVFEMHWAGP